MNTEECQLPLSILLAEDAEYDRFFFRKALKELFRNAQITTVNDGELLMDYLTNNYDHLPDFLFLDLNMPFKNGFECLTEIKQDRGLRGFPVVIYTTSMPQNIGYECSIMNMLLKIGAHDFICKTYDMPQLKLLIHQSLMMTVKPKADQ